MNDGKIYIVISEEEPTGRSNGGGSVLSNNKSSSKTKSEKSGSNFDKYVVHETMHLIRDETRKIINWRVSTIGSRTGDYIAQQNIQGAINIAYQAAGIGMAALAGAKYGPIGAMVGAGVGAILMGTSIFFQYDEMFRRVRIQNKDITILRHRAGLDNLNDGSRGTEN